MEPDEDGVSLEPFIDGLPWKKVHAPKLIALLDEYKKEGRKYVDIEIYPALEKDLKSSLKGRNLKLVGELRMGKTTHDVGPTTVFYRVTL